METIPDPDGDSAHLFPAATRLFWIGTGVFVLNDFLWISLQSGMWLYLADIVLRIIIIFFIYNRLRVSAPSPGSTLRFLFITRPEQPSGRAPAPSIVWWTVGTSMVGIAIDQTVWPFLYYRLPATALFSFPQISGPLYIVDLTVGVVLVAVSEEVIFRSLAFRVLRRVTPNRWPAAEKALFVVFTGSIIFGMIHWGNGVHAVISAALWGVMPMVALVRTGSIWPALIAHWATDLVAFSGLIPEAYYQLFAR